MSRQRALQSPPPDSEQPNGDSDRAHGVLDFSGPWFDTKTAAAYIPCKTVRAFYEWRKRHGVIARNNGSVAKADLDRILNKRKVRRVMASASLRNLRKRKAS